MEPIPCRRSHPACGNARPSSPEPRSSARPADCSPSAATAARACATSPRRPGCRSQTVYDSIGSKQAIVARLNDLIDAEADIAAIAGAAVASTDPMDRGGAGPDRPVDPRALRRHHPCPRHRRGCRARPRRGARRGPSPPRRGARRIVGRLRSRCARPVGRLRGRRRHHRQLCRRCASPCCCVTPRLVARPHRGLGRGHQPRCCSAAAERDGPASNRVCWSAHGRNPACG